MKLIKQLTTGVAALTLLATSALAQDMIKVASFTSEKATGVSKVIEPWMDAVSADLGDKVTMRGFWGGTLGKSPFKQFELVQNGVADAAWVLPSYTAGQFPEMGLFELPFLFRNAHEASTTGWKLYEAGLLTGFDGVHVVGFFSTEPNTLFMKQQIETLDGLKDLKIRSAGPIQARWLEEFGAAPQTLSSSEYNEALSRGTVDGVIQGWTGMATFKSFQLVEQSYEVPTGTIPFLFLMNEGKWNSLPAETQAAMSAHGGEAFADLGADAYTDAGEAIIEKITAEGKLNRTKVSEGDLDGYEERSKAVHDWWIERTPNGRVVYDAAVAILADIRAGN